MRWLKDTAPTFGVTIAPDGEPTDVGDVTVDVYRADGTQIVTGDPTTNNNDGTYTYSLALALASRVDRLRVVWTIVTGGDQITTYEEIVGALLFTEAEAVAYDDAALASITDPELIGARDRIADLFEHVTGTSFGGRYARVQARGPMRSNPYRLSLVSPYTRKLVGGPGYGYLPTEIIGATDSGGTVTVSELVPDPYGAIDRQGSTWSYDTPATTAWPITVDYEYGTYEIPLEIREAALRLARYELIVSDVTDRMISFADPNVGSVRLSIPSFRFPTGIPVIDATLGRHKIAGAIA
jgi:hypothetical protein